MAQILVEAFDYFSKHLYEGWTVYAKHHFEINASEWISRLLE